LGAGASATSVSTAGDLIWDFKRQLYCSDTRTPLANLADLGDQTVRLRLQRYFDERGRFPAAGDPSEYSFYFELAFPSPADRRRYVERLADQGTPSFGHEVLAYFLKHGRITVVWTTNFDRTIEDAAVKVLGGTGRLAVVDDAKADQAARVLNEGGRILLGKLHGDFLSTHLRNTEEEVRRQDERLRDALIETCKRFGLVVVGYSGRDDSVMNALEAAIDGGRGYPNGLYWVHRSVTTPVLRVRQLLERVRLVGREADLVEAETFDELMGDLLTLETGLPEDVLAALNERRPRRLSAWDVPPPATSYPIVRTNAFPLVDRPSTARLVRAKVPSWKDMRSAVAEAGVDVIVALRAGVLAFGADADLRRAFGRFGDLEMDVHPLEARRLGYESPELGLLYAALVRALARGLPLRVARRRSEYHLAVDPARATDPVLQPLARCVGPVSGVVDGVLWSEAVRVGLEFRLERCWCLLTPTVRLHWEGEGRPPQAAVDLSRERQATRYNDRWNSLLDGWREVFFGADATRMFSSFEPIEGVNARFTLARTTAYTGRRAA
jgi:hypothetical protein